MPNARRTTTVALDHRIWRDLTVLAAKSLVVGVVAGAILVLAVFAIA